MNSYGPDSPFLDPTGFPGAPAPQRPSDLPPESTPHLPGRREGITDRVTRKVSRIRQFEGPRGYSSRAAVYFRYLAYFLTIVTAAVLTQASTTGIRYAEGGGWVMLVSATTIVVVGAVATLFYANLRNEIVHRVRSYVFGYVTLSGTLVAVFLRIAQNWFGNDTFGSTLSAALPIVFLTTVVLPALVFAKEIISIRGLYRSRLDDEEAVALWTRQDGLQR